MVQAIRGAITVEENNAEAIYQATQEMLLELIDKNQLDQTEIISALFTVTPDLNAAFPATGARTIGWTDIPMVCAQEIPVPGALPLCIRVLIYINGQDKKVRHIYLREAAKLRPDLINH